MKLIKILFCLLLMQAAYGEEEAPSFNSIVDLEGIPSANVGNVNIITGDYCVVACDLIVEGPHPLSLERSYVSSGNQSGSLCHGWNLNHFGSLMIESISSGGNNTSIPHRRAMKKLYGRWKGGGGAEMYYESKSLKYETSATLNISPSVIKNGITNVGRGEISGRTNQKNSRIEWMNNRYYLFNGAGETHAFTKNKDPKSSNLKTSSVLFKSGLSTHYEYSPTGKLNVVRVKNLEGAIHSKLRFLREVQGEELKIEVRASDARSIKYKLSQYKMGRDKYGYLLNRVKYSDGYQESYKYEEFYHSLTKCNRIVETMRPEGRFQQTSYYDAGDNQVANQIIKLKKYDQQIGRVSQIKAPIGTDGTPLLVNAFTYHFDSQLNNTTSVLDALYHLKVYHHRDGRLKHIKYYTGKGEYALHADERFFWGQPGAADEGNLTGHLLQHPSGTFIWCRGYRYDLSGNILEEHFSGNLSGANTVHPYIDSYGFPLANGAEIEVKRYAYITDGRNLLTREFGSRAIKMLGYYENSDLLYAKFLATPESEIKKRQFFFYDDNKALVKEIIDDGSNGATDSDLTAVTRRIIRYYTTRQVAPIGLPEEIRECYLELSTGVEKQNRRVVKQYTPEGWCLSETLFDSEDAYVSTKLWEYDAAGRVIKETNPLGETIECRYDLNGNKIFEQGFSKEFHHELVYDFSNRLIREELVHNNGRRDVKRYEYNLLGEKVAEWDIRGNVTRYGYDDFGNVTTVVNALGEREERTYDILGHPVSLVDRDGETLFSYTSRGQKYGVRYPDGASESTRYNLDGTVKFSTTKDGTTTYFEYDYADRPISKAVYGREGEHLFTTYCTYDAFNMLTETDAAGVVTYYTYNEAGQLLSTKKGVEEMRYRYDSLGREVHTIQMTGEETAIVKAVAFDLLDRIVAEKIEDEKGNCQTVVETRYDSLGNVQQMIRYGENGLSIVENRYDAYKRLVETTDALGNVTHICYDDYFLGEEGVLGSLVTTTDPRGYRVESIKDALEREVRVIRRDPFGKEVARTDRYYDFKGRVVEQIEQVYVGGAIERSDRTQWKRDSVGNIVCMIEAAGSFKQRETLYQYNAAGQRMRQVKPDGVTLLFDYDSKGRLSAYLSDDHSFHYIYTYDLLDHPVDTYDVKTGQHSLRQFDENGYLLSETLANGLTVAYEYDRKGRPTRILLPDQSSIVYDYEGVFLRRVERNHDEHQYVHTYSEYDLRGTLLRSVLPENGGEISYTHDANGRVTEIDSSYWKESLTYDAVGNVIATQDEVYRYDDYDQLVKDGTHTYSYDSLHNRRSKDGEAYQLNPLNQIISVGETDYTYDLNGNRILLTSPNRKVCYRYDALDRLIEVEEEERRYCYAYDANNRRLSKKVYLDGQIADCEYYLYLDQNEVGSYSATYQPLELRILGNIREGELGAAVAIEKNGRCYYPVHDHQGSVVRLVNNDGSLFAGLSFTPFGEETTRSRPTAWTFSSKRYDPETALFYFGRRYYDPTLGRWITPDPTGYDDGPNLYAYVHNNPHTHFDAYGLRGVTFWDNFEEITGGLKSTTGQIEGNSPDAHSYSIFIMNGIATSFRGAKKNAAHASDLGGGVTVNYIYNRTRGMLIDLIECAIGLYLQIATTPARLLINELNAEFDKHGPDHLILLMAFSQATIHAKNTIHCLSPERAKRIVYRAFAPAAFTEPDKCFSAHYYISDHDHVWRFDQKKFNSNPQACTFVKAHPNASWFDHDFRGDTLRSSIIETIRDFKKIVDNNRSTKTEI